MGMRPGIGIPTISKRAKRVLIVIVSLVVLAILWFQFVGLYVDYLWYGEVGFRQVFTTQVVSRLVLFLVAGLGSGGLVLLTMLLAYRSRPVFVPTAVTNDPLAPYRTVVASRPKLFGIGISTLIGIICGLSAQGQWETVQLFLHGGSFGQTDPQFGHDVGFYVFKLPMIQMLLGWLFVITAICFFVALAIQYVFGGIRLQGAGRRVTSAATLQLSLLIGAFVLIKAIQYWFDRYDLMFSDRNGITGASYTDVNALLPAKIILMVIAVLCAVGFFVGAFLKSVKLPAIALALMVLSSVLIGGAWPLVLQQVVVKPNALQKEPPYIQRNINATQVAYGIGADKVSYSNYQDNTAEDPKVLEKDTQTVPNVRLLDPNLLSDTFTQKEQTENFYGFPNQLSVDRYKIGGKTQSYVVAAREIASAKLADNQTDWINQHLVYTHGDGFVAAPANTVEEGYPQFTVSDLNNEGTIPVTQPRIYYGELDSNYAIVGAQSGGAAHEYDAPGKPQFTYNGQGGVPVGNLFKRLVFGTYYGEANFLFSSQIGGNSKIMYHREVRDRVQKAAPFLTVDTNPYPAVVGGRIVWIVDAYTTADNYPYSQRISLSDPTTNSQSVAGSTTAQASTEVGYMRNSVKATVDAYDGTVKLYQVDDNDPMLKAWSAVFPGLILPQKDVSQELREHFRYPQDMFEVQRSLLAKYNVQNGTTFFQASNFWKIPDDPTEGQSITAAQPPYYQQLTLPGATQSTFELTSPLTGLARDFMAGYVSANGDPKNYGKLTVLRFPTQTQTPGPKLVQQLFRADSGIANWISTRINGGSAVVIYGNLLTLPIHGGLLYVEPLYLQGVSASSYPQLAQVLVWFSNRVGQGNTLSLALENASSKTPVSVAAVTGGNGANGTGSASIVTSSGGPQSSTSSSSVSVVPPNEAQALAAMNAALDKLNAAKKTGDQGQIGEANQKLEDAVQAYLSVATPSSVTGTPAAPPPASGASSTPQTAPAGG